MSEAITTPVLADAVNAELEDWGPLLSLIHISEPRDRG